MPQAQINKSILTTGFYEISDSVIYFPQKYLIVNISSCNLKRIQLRVTMGNLLHYFLLSSVAGFVSDEELMTEVWEKNDLRASSHRLWQVTRDLSFKLAEAGLKDPLYVRNRKRKGYTINSEIITLPNSRTNSIFKHDVIKASYA